MVNAEADGRHISSSSYPSHYSAYSGNDSNSDSNSNSNSASYEPARILPLKLGVLFDVASQFTLIGVEGRKAPSIRITTFCGVPVRILSFTPARLTSENNLLYTFYGITMVTFLYVSLSMFFTTILRCLRSRRERKARLHPRSTAVRAPRGDGGLMKFSGLITRILSIVLLVSYTLFRIVTLKWTLPGLVDNYGVPLVSFLHIMASACAEVWALSTFYI